MKISYGFVFYFEILMIVLTIALILLYFKPIRQFVFGFADKYRIGEGPIYNTAFWIIFAVIAIILFDSVLTYWAIRETLEIGTFALTQIPRTCLSTTSTPSRPTNTTTILLSTRNCESITWPRETSCSPALLFSSCSSSVFSWEASG